MSYEVYYRAWDKAAGEHRSGDQAQHTVVVRVDAADVSTFASGPTSHGDGLYSVGLSDDVLPEGSRFALRGSSATANVDLFGEIGVRPIPITKARIRAWVGGRWTDEDLATFDLTINDIP